MSKTKDLPTSYLTNIEGNASKILAVQNKHPIFSTLYLDLQQFLNSIEKKGYKISIDKNFSIYDSNDNFVAKVVFFNNKKDLKPKIYLEGKMGTVYKKCEGILASNILSQFTYSGYHKDFPCNSSDFLCKLDAAL